ncbi:MAG: hypothetical protein IKT46_04850 [Clostridia bacterium]|nr:hypothetical protein [Clostridia bacterium]
MKYVLITLKIMLAVCIVLTGICFAAGALFIYYGNNHTYTPEAISTVFGYISIPVYFTSALTVITAVISLFAPEQVKKNPKKNYSYILAALYKVKDLSAASEETKIAIAKKQRFRYTQKSISILLSIDAFIAFVYIIFQPQFYTFAPNDNLKILLLFIYFVILIIPAFIYSLIVNYTNNRSMKAESELIKALPKVPKEARCGNENAKHTNILKYMLIGNFAVLACIAIIIGALNNGTADILTKAINICNECIGLG